MQQSLTWRMPFTADDDNRNPGDGCLMDAGADRPFDERAAQPGFPESRFCAGSDAYWREILPRSP